MTPEQSTELIEAIHEHGLEIRYATLFLIVTLLGTGLVIVAAIAHLTREIALKQI
jgi:hypothetical protein